MSANVYFRVSSMAAASNGFGATVIFFFCSDSPTASITLLLISADSATIISEPFALSLVISTLAGRITALRIVTFFARTSGCRYWASTFAANRQDRIIKTKRTGIFIRGLLFGALIIQSSQNGNASSYTLVIDCARRELQILRILARRLFFSI